MDLTTKKMKIITPDLSWDVDEFEQSWDGKWIAFLSNEDGLGKLHLLEAATGKERPVPKLPVGLMGGLIWHRNNRDLGFALLTGSAPGDCYSLDVAAGKVERWTMSETAVNLSGLHDAELIRWKTFDGRSISGFLYRPPTKFMGRRPVLIEIHGDRRDRRVQGSSIPRITT
jgi:dipeptidyl aminopeptidase/acylaminoacyl peptidase